MLRALSVLTVGLGVAMFWGCASTPPSPPTSAAALGDLYARLSKERGQYVVGPICRKDGSRRPSGESRYPECEYRFDKPGRLYFNVETLEPAYPDFVCNQYNLNDPKKSGSCDDYPYLDLYSTSVGSSVASGVLSVLKMGTEKNALLSIDQPRFQQAIESALPTQRRQALINEEVSYRASYQSRMAADQRQAQEAAQRSREAQAQQRQALEAQARQAILAAEQRFSALSNAPKSTGMTICSRDNRMGYVEQVSGSKIKILVKGQAVAERDAIYGHGNPLGPFKVDTSSLNYELALGEHGKHLELPVLDPLYLFKPHRGVRIAPINPGQIWDESGFWAACDWRV